MDCACTPSKCWRHSWEVMSITLSKVVFRRRQWHPTPVLVPGKSHGQRSLVGCSPWGRWESDTTERLHFHALEKEMATHSSVLAWRIPGMGKPGGLPSMGSHRVRHDWSNLAAASSQTTQSGACLMCLLFVFACLFPHGPTPFLGFCIYFICKTPSTKVKALIFCETTYFIHLIIKLSATKIRHKISMCCSYWYWSW